jgi:uroporphyrinogen decarboxylase
MTIPGQFWWTRDYLGLHNLLKSLFMEPLLVHQMMDFYTDFILEVLHPLLDETEIDVVTIDEDMAYKTGPMISPSLFKEFMFNNYRRVTKLLREHNVKVIFWDSDGNPGALLPLIVKAGMNGWVPMEIAAGVDPLEVRKQFPQLVLGGGIDKRVLASGKKADIQREISKTVPVLLESGGYLPMVDHAVAPETPLENYVHYLRALNELGVGSFSGTSV